MSSLPWEPDRPLDVEMARSAVPLGVAVPLVELLGAPSPDFPYTFAGHRFIEGVAADVVDPSRHAEMARTIAAALGAIHSIPIAGARAAGVSEMGAPGDGTYQWFRRNLAGASGLIDSNRAVRQAVAWVSELDEPLRSLDAPLRFIHQDLSPEHLVVTPSTGRLAGILDWTAAVLGDAARDFVTCATFGGWDFVDRVLAHYPGPVDAAFQERLQYMARLLSVMWLGEAQQNGGDVRKCITWVENAFAPRSAP